MSGRSEPAQQQYALLRKISTTEWTSLGHQFGEREHRDLQTPHVGGVTRQDLT
jgi:hypothetical protein